jgi:arylsulfatase A-like enzyme
MNSPCLRSVAFPSFLLALVAAILPTAVRAAEDHPIPARPNIVFILADDLGYGDLASYGHLRIKTPHLDQLAAEGTRFTQYYTHAVCSPSRVALLTGQHPARWQVYAPIVWLSVNAKNNMADWLDPRAPSLPRALQQAGYHTALFGKWHLGGGSGRSFTGKAINSPDAPLPNAYGYDETRTYVGNGPGWRGTTPVAEPHDLYVVEDDEFVRWSSKLIADEAIAFLDRRKAAPREPFLLQVHFHDPHVPLRPTEEMEKPYADITDLGARAYYAVVTDMDYHVGRILSQLDQLGLRDNTLVIFTSDNGTPARQGRAAIPAGVATATTPPAAMAPCAAGSGTCMKAVSGCRLLPAGPESSTRGKPTLPQFSMYAISPRLLPIWPVPGCPRATSPTASISPKL